MRLHKLKASESTGTYLVESPLTENDILPMARQLANLRLRRGRALTSPKAVFTRTPSRAGARRPGRALGYRASQQTQPLELASNDAGLGVGRSDLSG